MQEGPGRVPGATLILLPSTVVCRGALFALLLWASSDAFASGDSASLDAVAVKHPSWKRVLGARAPRLKWPLATRGAVTSPFGERFHPIERIQRRHTGVDLAAEPQQPVVAAATGRVLKAGWLGSHGYQVEVQHAGGLRTRYSHLSALLVEPGAFVEAGSVLGLAGDTGAATGVHLHFEVWRNGRASNPLQWFRIKPARTRQYVTRPSAPPREGPKGSS